jgi:hypothetical protein
MKVTLAHVRDELDTIPAFALCIGPAMYLVAFIALRLRVSRTLGRGRVIAAVACIAVFPVALAVPALLALTPRRRRLDRITRLRAPRLARRARRNTRTPRIADGS